MFLQLCWMNYKFILSYVTCCSKQQRRTRKTVAKSSSTRQWVLAAMLHNCMNMYEEAHFFYNCCYVRCCSCCYVITASFSFVCHTCCCWYYVSCCCCCYVTAATISFLCHLLLLVLCYLLLNSTASVLLILTTPCIPCRTDTKENGCSTCKSRRCYWRT